MKYTKVIIHPGQYQKEETKTLVEIMSKVTEKHSIPFPRVWRMKYKLWSEEKKDVEICD